MMKRRSYTGTEYITLAVIVILILVVAVTQPAIYDQDRNRIIEDILDHAPRKYMSIERRYSTPFFFWGGKGCRFYRVETTDGVYWYKMRSWNMDSRKEE